MLKQKVWKAGNIICLAPDELLDDMATETCVDCSVKKLHGKSIFKLFLFAFLNGGSVSLRSVLALLRVILEHPEAEPCERGRDVVRRTSNGVDETVGVVADVIREPVGVREHHRVLHHCVLTVKRADCRHLRRREIVPRRPENFHIILHFRARGLWP